MSTRRLVTVGLVLSLLVAGVLSTYASRHPDGLQHVAASLGFASDAQASATSGSPLAGYAVQGVSDPRLSGGLAGVAGVVVVGALMTGLVLLLRRRAPKADG
ncbi:MAG TPA: PDGLE domain-containing protein [Phycicoccus sp.]|nr:PDGLE domain-containing protein [Phycicoccus sp.]